MRIQLYRAVFAILLTAGWSLASADVIKLGLSVPLTGPAANWGKGGQLMCELAASEVAREGGVKVGGKTHTFECVTYDNKYSAAEGEKVAQALLDTHRVRFIGGALGTAPTAVLQSRTERENVLLFTTAWGASIKGPNFPLTFTQMSTPNEISGPLVQWVKRVHPQLRTVALLNPNDATGRETEKIARKAWEAAGVKVVSSDWYERGTTAFLAIAAKIAAQKPDAVDLCASPPADSGYVFKSLAALNWDGVKVEEVGTGAEGLLATGGKAVSGTYLGAALTLDGITTTAKQKALNEAVKSRLGEPINAVQIGFYDAVKALKAAMEKSQSLDPGAVGRALPDVIFDGFYGKQAFGATGTYGSPQQILAPVVVTQIWLGRLVEVDRLVPAELKARLLK